MVLTGLKPRCQEGPIPFLDALGENPFSYLFQHFWLLAPFHLQCLVESFSEAPIFCACPTPSTFKDRCDYIGSTWIISLSPGQLFNNINFSSSPFCHVSLHIHRTQRQTSLGGHYSAYNIHVDCRKFRNKKRYKGEYINHFQSHCPEITKSLVDIHPVLCSVCGLFFPF